MCLVIHKYHYDQILYLFNIQQLSYIHTIIIMKTIIYILTNITLNKSNYIFE